MDDYQKEVLKKLDTITKILGTSARNEENKKMIHQNEIIMSLLGRLVFTPEKIRDIVEFKKQNPANYIEGYNKCDGNHTVSGIAKIVGVAQGTLSPILSDWEDIGIIYEVERPKGKFYKKLYPI